MQVLLVTDKTGATREYPLSSVLTIGRDESNDIVLDSKDVQAFHASILQNTKGGNLLFNHTKRNITRIGESKVRFYELTPGTTFRIGPFHFTLTDSSKARKREQAVKTSKNIPISLDDSTTADEVTSPDAFLSNEAGTSENASKRLALVLSLSSEVVSILDYQQTIQKALQIAMETFEAKRGLYRPAE